MKLYIEIVGNLQKRWFWQSVVLDLKRSFIDPDFGPNMELEGLVACRGMAP